MIDIYYRPLMKFPDKEIAESAEKCFEDCDYFPTVKDMLQKLPKRAIDKHSKELSGMYICQVCNEKVSAISNGECLDCAQINPQLAGVRYKLEYRPYERESYRMHGRMKCQKCGKGPTLCIKKPRDTGPWLCKDCYRGYDDEEYHIRWKKIHFRGRSWN